MSLVSTAIAASQIRLVSPADDEYDELQRLIDAAEAVVVEYLDRYVFVDQPTMLTAQAAMPATFQAAYTAWLAAYAAQDVPAPVGYPNVRCQFDNPLYGTDGWGADAFGSYGDYPSASWVNIVVLDPVQLMAIRAANDTYRTAFREAERTFQAGYYSVSDGASPPVITTTRLGAVFTHAVLLLVSNYDVNREAVNVDTSSAIVMPFGVADLLFPHRKNLGVGR